MIDIIFVTIPVATYEGGTRSSLISRIFMYEACFFLQINVDRDDIFRLSPFVFFYGTVFDLDLVIDASDYGNDARFIRRSCQPNASVSFSFMLQFSFLLQLKST